MTLQNVILVAWAALLLGLVVGAAWARRPREEDVPPPAPEWSPDALERAMASDDVVKVRAVRSGASRWN